ncbi:hypothetical protein Fmac_022306 [Flemingia macrophylla]|uniref:Uncharacterized protein n=1 Tax=Flemingia macrophylla TaxID=520843 RepID=A0ABD1LZB5_9FABA
MKFQRTDARSLLSQFKRREKQIKLKSRWLLGIPPTRSERKKLKKYFKNKYLSESLLREDDIFHEAVRIRVEDAFGGHRIKQEKQASHDDMDLIQIPNMKRLISWCLDNFTINGLYLLAKIVTGDSFNYEMTRCKLKKVIKGSVSRILGSKDSNHVETQKQIFMLLTNPQNFHDRCEPLPALRSQSCRAAVAQILHGLQNLPSQTLIAMRRKLKGVKAPVPQLQPQKHGWARDHLINLVKKISRKMLSQLERESELQEPLAKAMAIADLSLELTTGCHNIFAQEFYQFSPEVKSLQSDIMNAIWSVKKKVSMAQLRNLQLLVEPKATISNRCLRSAFVNFLTEFLFECSDMDSVPAFLLQTLDVINRGSNSGMHGLSFKKKDVEEEVDCILNMSASTKQIVLDLLPDDEFDKDFIDAYLEQPEESDDSGSNEDDDDSQLQEDIQFRNGTNDSMDSFYEAESVGDFAPFDFDTSGQQLQPNNCNKVNLESNVYNTPYSECQRESTEQFSTVMLSTNNCSSVLSPEREFDKNVIQRNGFPTDTKIDETDITNLFGKETEPIKYGACKNQYLVIQNACDKTSMLAYNLIGHMLEEFAINECQDLNLSKSLYLSGHNHIEEVEGTDEKSSSRKRARDFVQVIEELIPSFPDSSMERLKMLMGL